MQEFYKDVEPKLKKASKQALEKAAAVLDDLSTNIHVQLDEEKTECCGIKVEWERGLAPEICPGCGDKYYSKPNLEFKLFHLQDEFVADYERTGSTHILGGKMFPLMVEYAENLIKMLLKGKTCLSPANLHEKANDSATRLIEVILNTPDHRMKYSFGEYLKRLCKNEAYRDKNNDQTYSMQFILGEDTEFGDTISRKEVRLNDDGDRIEETVTLNNRYEHQHDLESDLSKELCGLVWKIKSIIKENTRSDLTSIMFLIGLHSKLSRRSDKTMEDFYEIAGNSVRAFVEKSELVIYQHLQNRQMQ